MCTCNRAPGETFIHKSVGMEVRSIGLLRFPGISTVNFHSIRISKIKRKNPQIVFNRYDTKRSDKMNFISLEQSYIKVRQEGDESVFLRTVPPPISCFGRFAIRQNKLCVSG